MENLFKKIYNNLFVPKMETDTGLRGNSSGELYVDKKVFYNRLEVQKNF